MRLNSVTNQLVRVGLCLALVAGGLPWPVMATGAGSVGTVPPAVQPVSARPLAASTEPATVAQPVSVWRVQSSHVAGTLVVTYTVSNNLPPSRLPALDPAATVTDTVSALAAFSETDDINTLRSASLATDLAAGAALLSASPGLAQNGTSLTWALGDLAPASQTVITAALQTPAQGGDFVELEVGAQVTALRWGEPVGASARPAVLVPAGTDPLLTAPTAEADAGDPDMLWASATFGQDPLAAFEYVQAQGFDPYSGSLRGTRGTLWGASGNALDQASLLIAMLRAAGVPARYRHGSLSTAEAQALIDGMFPATPGLAGHLPAGTPLADPRSDPALIATVADHWWVEAYLPGTGWQDLDPAFSDTAPGDVRATPAGDGTDRVTAVPDAFRHMATLSLEVERYSQFPTGGGPLTRMVPLTATLPVAALASRPLRLGHLVETNVQGGAPFSTVSHTYTPYFSVHDSDEVTLGQTFQDVLTNFPLGSAFTTAAWLHVAVTDPAGHTETFTREIKDSLGLDLRLNGGNLTLATPADNAAFFGPVDLFVLWFLPNRVDGTHFSERQRERLFGAGLGLARDLEPASDLFALTNPTPEEFAALRDATLAFQAAQAAFYAVEGLEYAQLADRTAGQLEHGLRVKFYYDQPRVIGLTSLYDAEAETVVKTIDLRHAHAQALAYPGQSTRAVLAANWLKGVSESYHEGQALARTTGLVPVTTARLFDEMAAQGINPLWITPDTADLLALYDFSPASPAYAEKALLEGRSILIPSAPVTVDGQPRLGWWEVDPATGQTVGVLENGLHLSLVEWTAISIGFGFPFTLNEVYGLQKTTKEIWDYVVCHVVPALGGTSPFAAGGDECTLTNPFGMPWPLPTPGPSAASAASSGRMALARQAGLTAAGWMDLPAHLCPIDACGLERFVFDADRAGPMPLPDLAFAYADPFLAQTRVHQAVMVTSNGGGGAPALALSTNPAPTNLPAGQAATFDIDLDANFGDTVEVNVYAPTGWFVTFTDADTVQVAAPPATAPGAYTLSLTAQPGLNSSVTATAEHTVNLTASGAVALSVSDETQLTVPAGQAAFAAVSGQTNDAEAEIPDSAYVLTLDNPSAGAVTVAVDVTGAPAGWLVLDGAAQSSTTVSLGAGETHRLGLYVVPPPGAVPSPGTSYTLDVDVTQSGTPVDTDTIPWTMPDQAFNYVTLAPASLYLGPSSSLDFGVSVASVGNAAGTFPLTASLPPAVGTVSNVVSPHTLAPGEAATFTATLQTTSAPLGARFPIWLASPAPGSYTQYALADVQIVSAVTEPVFRAADRARTECPLSEPGLSAALEALALAMGALETSCASGACDTFLRDQVVNAAQTAALYARAAWPALAAGDGVDAAAALLAAHTDPADILDDLQSLSASVTALEDEVCLVCQHRLEARWQPAYGAALLGQPITYTLDVTNQGTLTTTYDVTVTLPAGTQTFSLDLGPGATASTPYSVSVASLGVHTLLAEVAAAGLPLTDTATARLNSVERFVQLTAVTLDPAFVDTGTSATALTIEVSNVANVPQAVTAHAEVLAASGALSHTSDTALNLLTGAPRTYALGDVNTSGWAAGVYTVTVQLLDGQGVLVPDGENYAYLSVGQALGASHSVVPLEVPPGALTVTTVMTTELLDTSGTAGVGPSATTAAWAERPLLSVEPAAGSASRALARPFLSAPSSVHAVDNTGVITRTENTSPTITYSPGWGSSGALNASGGSYHSTNLAGRVLTYTFSGPWVNIGFMGWPTSGLAEVFLDGASQGIVDTYRNDAMPIEQVYAGLVDTTHTLTVTVLGTRNPLSGGYGVSVDFIDTWGGLDAPQGVTENDSPFIFRGLGWGTENNAAASGGSYATGSGSVWFLFTGDSITYQGFAHANGGIVRLYVDGQYKASANLYSHVGEPRTLSLDGLGAGAHVLRMDAHYLSQPMDALITPGTAPFYTPPVLGDYQRYEEDDPALLYNGLPYTLTHSNWSMPFIGPAIASEQRYASSNVAGNSVSLTFDGVWAAVGFNTFQYGGLAEVFVDGVSQGQVGTYSPTDDVLRVAVGNLVTGTHTISVTVLGQPDPPSAQNNVLIDYIEVWDGTPLPDAVINASLIDRDERLSLGGRLAMNNHAAAIDGDFIGMGLGGGSADTNLWYAFTGDAFTFYAFTSPNAPAQVELRVDEGLSQTVNIDYPFSQQPMAFHFSGYGPGIHVARLSNVVRLQVDAFAANPSSQQAYQPVAEWWDNTQGGGSIWGGIVSPVSAGDLNNDGVVEIVVASSDIAHNGSLAVYRGDGGDSGDGDPILWQVPYNIFNGFEDVAAPVIAELDGQPGAEIVLPTEIGLYVYHADGTPYWYTDTLRSHVFFGSPAIGNLDLDPMPEVVVNLNTTLAVFEHDGTLAWSVVNAQGQFNPVLADLTGDGLLDILINDSVDELTLWDYNLGQPQIAWTAVFTSQLAVYGGPAVADLDGHLPGGDAGPEIAVGTNGFLHLLDANGGVLWSKPLAAGTGGGVSVGDLDGDGAMEILASTHSGTATLYGVEGDGSTLWSIPVGDNSPANASLMDLDGDGDYEVAWTGPTGLHLFDGLTGNTLFVEPAVTSQTGSEFPIFVDVDNDGYGELIVPAQGGLRVFGYDGVWGPARPLWNQPSYHVTNVHDNLSIPVNETNSWEAHNTYRTQTPEQTPVPVVYAVTVDHTVGLSGLSVLTGTFNVAPDTAADPLYGWTYTQTTANSVVTRTFQTALTGLLPGEVREVAQGTVITYQLPAGGNVLALPQLYVTAQHLLALAPSPLSAGAGTTAVYTVTLNNPLDQTATYTMTVAGEPAAWAGVPGPVPVPAGQTLALTLPLTLPAGTAPGTYGLSVAVSTDLGGSDQAAADLEVVAAPVQLDVLPDAQSGPAGTPIEYTLVITNNLAASRTFDLTGYGLASLSLPAQVAVGAASSATLTFTAEAAGAGPHPFTVLATAPADNATASDSAVLNGEAFTRVALSLNPASAGSGPGMAVGFEVTLQNLADQAITVDLSVTPPTGWEAALTLVGAPVTALTLAPGTLGTATLDLRLTSPAGASAGDYAFTVSASPAGGASGSATSVEGLVQIGGAAVDVVFESGPGELPGNQGGAWAVRITNTGDAPDSYELSAFGPLAALASLPAATPVLGPGESQVVTLTTAPSAFGLPGLPYTLGVLAQSQSHDPVYDQAAQTVTFAGYHGLEAAWLPGPQTTPAGQPAQFTLVITNTGNLPATVSLAVTADAPAVAILPLAGFTLPPFGAAVQGVAAQAPQPGTYTLQAQAGDGQVTASAETTLEVTEALARMYLPFLVNQAGGVTTEKMFLPVLWR